MMDRREFLKMAAVAVVATQVPIDLLAKIRPGFDSSKEYGRAVAVHSEKNIDFAVMVLKRDAAQILPKGTRYAIGAMMPQDFGRTYTLAWHYSPEVANDNWPRRFQEGPEMAFQVGNGFYTVGD